ncbi:MAG: hypothetical protein ACKVJJ_02750 [Fidelibacterota bacterium]|jgi:hypothetical protein
MKFKFGTIFNSYKGLKIDWLNLKLRYSYGRFQNKFGGVLSGRQVKLFFILQGNIILEESSRNKEYYTICSAKESYGPLD